MAARLGLPADARWASALWNRAAELWNCGEPAGRRYDEAAFLRDLDSGGQWVVVDSEARGFLVCHKEARLPEVPATAAVARDRRGARATRIAVWVFDENLTERDLRAVLAALISKWIDLGVAYGLEWGFGEVPEDVPPGLADVAVTLHRWALRFFDDWGIGVTRFERNGVWWRRYWGHMDDRNRLPSATTVT